MKKVMILFLSVVTSVVLVSCGGSDEEKDSADNAVISDNATVTDDVAVPENDNDAAPSVDDVDNQPEISDEAADETILPDEDTAPVLPDFSCSLKGSETACTADAECTCSSLPEGMMAACAPKGTPVYANKCLLVGCKTTDAATCPEGKKCTTIPAGTPGIPKGYTTVCW